MKSGLKSLILVFSFLALLSACGSKGASSNPTPVSSVEWTWVSGSNTANQAGTYGTLDQASSSNVPGARDSAASWLDSSGKLWLFGGSGYDSAGSQGRLNDLWEYEPATHEWTWVSGSNTVNQAGIYGSLGTTAASNVPGARFGAVSWRDSSGKLWLFGGLGYDSIGNFDDLNDLWEYDPATLDWTWISGSNIIDQAGIYGTLGTASSSNAPGARLGAESWLDSSGKLWLFGGSGYDSAGNDDALNDLWKFDPTTLEWTWVSGSNTVDQLGTYGTLGQASSSNIPGARYGVVSWLDSSGKFWLFGGLGLDSADNDDALNDLWEYDPATLEWTWVSGSNTVDQAGTYGTMGTASSSNVPGARYSAVSWLDSSGKLWLFGGAGYDSTDNSGNLNDLWEYDPATLEWTWISGSNSAGQAGTYGTMGTASSSNIPGARNAAVSWLDSSGNLWLFGGYGQDSVSTLGYLNDLWQCTR
jgi:N-acetylneuraminic acid mutarotase